MKKRERKKASENREVKLYMKVEEEKRSERRENENPEGSKLKYHTPNNRLTENGQRILRTSKNIQR